MNEPRAWFQLISHNAPYTSHSELSLTGLTSSMKRSIQHYGGSRTVLQRLFLPAVKNSRYGGHELPEVVAKPFVYFRSLSVSLNVYLLAFIQFIGCNGLWLNCFARAAGSRVRICGSTFGRMRRAYLVGVFLHFLGDYIMGVYSAMASLAQFPGLSWKTQWPKELLLFSWKRSTPLSIEVFFVHAFQNMGLMLGWLGHCVHTRVH